MKKLMMIAAMMLMSMGAFAQNEVGQVTLQPKVGMNLSTITGGALSDKKTKVGLVAGVEAEYGVAENFGLSAGVLYSMEGIKYSRKYLGADATIRGDFDYINIPILANYYLVKGLAVKAGVQPAFNVRHKEKFEASANGQSISETEDAEGVQSFNFSIPVGLSYEYESFVLDARYNIGITKIFKDADEGRNSTFSITIGYKFAL